MAKKPAKTSPTQRSLKMLRRAGYVCAIVEHWNQYARIRQDLFGFGDILAIRPAYKSPRGEQFDKPAANIIVQTTTSANANARIKKIRTKREAWVWLQVSNNLIDVHGWRKAKDGEWLCSITAINQSEVKLGESNVRRTEDSRGTMDGAAGRASKVSAVKEKTNQKKVAQK